jgi:tRNA A-37 threonylcarbamoyl transferase component Bud32
MSGQIAHYRLSGYIGRGAMAVVYLAQDQRTGGNVAVKVVAPELANDAAFRSRFLAESRMAAAISHPHIIPVYDSDEAAGNLYVAMRYVQGGDARSLLNRHGPLPVDWAWTIIAGVASALDAAHAHGLIHGDVRPANMLLDTGDQANGAAQPTAGDAQPTVGGPGHVYLSDFGMSRSSTSSEIIAAGQVEPLDYAAPEQIERHDLDGRADLYSLACAGFELLCGTPPFGQDQGLTLMYAQLYAPAPSAADRRPDLPSAVDAVMATALAKNPAERFATCGQFAEALRAALGSSDYASPGPPPAAVGPAMAAPAAAVPATAAPAVPVQDGWFGPVQDALAGYGQPEPDAPGAGQASPPPSDTLAGAPTMAGPPTIAGEPTMGEELPGYGPPTMAEGPPLYAPPATAGEPPGYGPPTTAEGPLPYAPHATAGEPHGYGPPMPAGEPHGYGPPMPAGEPQGYGPPTAGGPPTMAEGPLPYGPPNLGGAPAGYGSPTAGQPTMAMESPGYGPPPIAEGPPSYGGGWQQHPLGPPPGAPPRQGSDFISRLRGAYPQSGRLPTGKKLVFVAAAVAVVIVGIIAGVSLSGGSSPSTPTASSNTTSPTPSASPSAGTLASKQAAAVSGLLSSSEATRRSLEGAVSDVRNCSSLGSAASQIQAVASQRNAEFRRASALSMGALANGAVVKSDLLAALRASRDADRDYLTWARRELRSGCRPNSQPPAYNAAVTADSQAGSAKATFVQVWNPVAAKYGDPQESAVDI